MDKLSQINVKNVSADKWSKLLRRFPASPSLIMRALISHALEMSDADYLAMINKQADAELKQKGIK